MSRTFLLRFGAQDDTTTKRETTGQKRRGASSGSQSCPVALNLLHHPHLGPEKKSAAWIGRMWNSSLITEWGSRMGKTPKTSAYYDKKSFGQTNFLLQAGRLFSKRAPNLSRYDSFHRLSSSNTLIQDPDVHRSWRIEKTCNTIIARTETVVLQVVLCIDNIGSHWTRRSVKSIQSVKSVRRDKSIQMVV